MTDPANENDRLGDGVTWRFRQSGDEIVVGSGDAVVLELTDAHGSALASVSLPTETIDELLRPHVAIFAELQLDGSVAMDTEFFALFPPSKTTDIYELVKEGIAPEKLEDESDVKERLRILKKRLTDALALVETTLANLDKPVA
jgi:hypothetical protein